MECLRGKLPPLGESSEEKRRQPRDHQLLAGADKVPESSDAEYNGIEETLDARASIEENMPRGDTRDWLAGG